MSETAGDAAGIRKRIRDFLSTEIIVDDTVELTDETGLLGGLVDSTGLMELVAFLEDEFDVSLDYADVDSANFRTVSHIAELVQRKADGA